MAILDRNAHRVFEPAFSAFDGMHGDDAMLFGDDECGLGWIGGISALLTTRASIPTNSATLRASGPRRAWRARCTGRPRRAGKLQAIAAGVAWLITGRTWIAFVALIAWIADHFGVFPTIAGCEIAT
jgi:hypothetical protein